MFTGSVVFQIPHRPNAKLTIRFQKTFKKCIFLASQDGFPQWPRHGGGGWQQHPQLLHHVRHRQLGKVRILVEFYAILYPRVMEKMGEGMRIHISSISKELLDMVPNHLHLDQLLKKFSQCNIFELFLSFPRLGASDAITGVLSILG